MNETKKKKYEKPELIKLSFIDTKVNIKGNFQVFTTDVTTVAQDLGLIVAGIPVLNTPIHGAFSKITGLVSLETLTKVIEKKWQGEIGRRNAQAAKITFQKTISY